MDDHTPPSGDKARRRKPRHRAVELLPEVRFWNGTLVEVREKANTNEIILSGTPIVFDQDYTVRDIFGEFTERMAPSVADDVLARGVDCRFLFNHDGMPLARTINGHTGGAGTMQLEKSPTALNMTVTLDARQQLANDLMVAIERGDVAEMSCGFIVARDEWDADMEDRTVLSFAELLDVSAVTYPCSPTTHIDVAQRMVGQMPIESRERVRKIVAVTRAGKVLSSANEAKLNAAHEAISAVLDAAKPVEADSPESDVEEVRHPDGTDDAPPVATNPDATMGGTSPGDSSAGSQGVQDATGSRAEDDPSAEERAEDAPESEVSTEEQEEQVSRGSGTRFLLEARKRRRSF